MLQTAKLLADMLKPTAEKKEEKAAEVKYMPLAFDEEIQTQDMKIIKSVIPFMALNQQKVVGIAIKLIEIRNILDKSEQGNIESAENVDKDAWYKGVLSAVKPYCDDKKQNSINVVMRMLEMKKILIQLEQLKEVL